MHNFFFLQCWGWKNGLVYLSHKLYHGAALWGLERFLTTEVYKLET
jgi:hypothetical protein